MLRAIIFDFDGVIADTEPIHLKAFQNTLEEKGITLSEEQYNEKYLAYDDKTFFNELLKDRNIPNDEDTVSHFISRKSEHFNHILKGNILILEGVPDFIKQVSYKFPLSIGSGALTSEIVEILEYAGLRDYFNIIVSADDVQNCKPDPEVYLKVLGLINETSSSRITADECLVIEDSISGIMAAHSAGMKCLAITNSYSEQDLSEAELVTNSLKSVSLNELEALFS